MFKTALTAAAFALIAGLSHAAPAPMELGINPTAPTIIEAAQLEELAYFCEWAYVYDYWGNWVTVWQCY